MRYFHVQPLAAQSNYVFCAACVARLSALAHLCRATGLTALAGLAPLTDGDNLAGLTDATGCRWLRSLARGCREGEREGGERQQNEQFTDLG